jgi:hypothetical protein
MSRLISLLALTSLSIGGLLTSACVTDAELGGNAVKPEKADDFLSASASEYVLESRTFVTIEAELADEPTEIKLARAKELIGYKQVAIAWFLTQYFVAKEHDEPNAEYGGMGGMAKAGAYEDFDVKAVNGRTYAFTFKQIVAGGNDLMNELDMKTLTNGKRGFELEIGRPTNLEMEQLETNNEWYRKVPWKSWNPANQPASKKELLEIAIKREKLSTDAYFDYPALFADGRLTIDVHFGWDYHDDFHVKHTKDVFAWLKRRGYTPPVSTFTELRRDSGPFTKTILSNGEDLDIEIRLFYGADDTETDPNTDAGGKVLEKDIRASFADRDAIVYSGHSGPFYGFAMGNWKKTTEGDFDDAEMASVRMPRNRYQIVFAEGCDTYHIGEALRSNPAKPDGQFIDVITTTSFSNASSAIAVKDFISKLTEIDTHRRHRPRTMIRHPWHR